MKLFDIIKKPIVSEKASILEMKNSTYVLEVLDNATKIDIKKAILDIYKVEIQDVRIVSTREKFKQWKKWTVIKKRAWKKAYVTLKDNKNKIDFSILK